jgi:putative ABC transport system ATP-binding protein
VFNEHVEVSWHVMDTLVEARDLTRVFSTEGAEVRALDGADLAVEPGEFVAIMGPSGCGKSTLLHLLGGLDRPTSGTIHLAGERVDQLSEAEWAVRRRRQIGYVFQFFNLIQNLSVADNIELGALIGGLPAAEARRRSSELADELDIVDRLRLAPAKLSGGEQQRVAIARALVNEPLILLADEPTGNLDSASAEGVLELLQRYHARGQTTVMVTHDAEVAAVADRIVYMRDGQVLDGMPLEADRERAAAPVRAEV